MKLEPGITIDGHGPYEDRNRASCGYGEVSTGPEADVSCDGSSIRIFRSVAGEPRFEIVMLVRNNGPETADAVELSVDSASSCPILQYVSVGVFDAGDMSTQGQPLHASLLSNRPLQPNQPGHAYVCVVVFSVDTSTDCFDQDLVFNIRVTTASVDTNPLNDTSRISVNSLIVNAERALEFLPPDDNDQARGLGAPRDVQLLKVAGGPGQRVLPLRSKTPAPLPALSGYLVYTSLQPNVQPVQSNLFATLPPDQTSVDVSISPAGSYFVVTALYGDGRESGASSEVGGVLPTIDSVKITRTKIVANGTDFPPDERVLLEGLRFGKPAKVKAGRKLTQKGMLETGDTIGELLDRIESGSTVLLLFTDGKGNTVAYPYGN